MANLVSTTFTGDVSLNGNGTLRANGQVDATAFTGNGAGLTGVDPFEAGTSMIFNQAAAPTGWTKQTGTALANTAMSIVTGTGGGTGGSDSFYSTFAASRSTETKNLPVSGSVSGSVGNFSITTPTMASHNHPATFLPNNQNFKSGPAPNNGPPGGATGFQSISNPAANNPEFPMASALGNAGGGGAHNHPFSGNLSSANAPSASFAIPAMNVKYANVIVANKD